jgi:hypothetical protein
MNISDVLKAVLPILVACIGWLLSEVGSFQTRLTQIEGKMPALITSEGVPTDSPISSERRNQLRRELEKELADVQVRIRLLEERQKGAK